MHKYINKFISNFSSQQRSGLTHNENAAVLENKKLKSEINKRKLERGFLISLLGGYGCINVQFIKDILGSNFEQYKPLIKNAKAQLAQDLFVCHQTNMKRDGYFVEFGAANGEELSNTYLLEREFGWDGILAEPGVSWHTDLENNRNCNIEKKCVWTTSNEELIFSDTDNHYLSTISNFETSDKHAKYRAKYKSYSVETISLIDLLRKYDAPKLIDYLSIDTEGSEFDILSAFDYDEYEIRIITVEHNYSERREDIYNLLTKKNYRRVYDQYSRFDDWYIKVD